MNTLSGIEVGFAIGDEVSPPRHDNDNDRLLPDWMTPAELMQWLRQEKDRLERELVADERLWACPEHRLTRDINEAMERCVRWQCYGER